MALVIISHLLKELCIKFETRYCNAHDFDPSSLMTSFWSCNCRQQWI